MRGFASSGFINEMVLKRILFPSRGVEEGLTRSSVFVWEIFVLVLLRTTLFLTKYSNYP